MKRQRNFSLWTGFLLVLIGLGSYTRFFALFPITRDFPWMNLLLLAGGAVLLGVGLRRAFQQPALYRGRVVGSIFALLASVGAAGFGYGIFYVARNLPPAMGAPRVGTKAPDFTLPDQNGQAVTLATLLTSPGPGFLGARANGALLIFYRGHW